MYRRVLPLLLTAVLLLSGCTAGQKNMPQKTDEKEMAGQPSDMSGEGSMYMDTTENVIYLAGGCFWGMEHLMQSIPGVIDAESGYANGTCEADADYKTVCKGETGFREAVRVEYDPGQVSLDALLLAYFYVIDPTVENRQGNDRGSQYQTGVYYTNESAKETVERIAVSSNGEAARLAAQDVAAVAIAGQTAAEIYGLHKLAVNIEDEPNNTTRFLVLGHQQTVPTGRDKTSLVFSTPNKAGAVNALLAPFSAAGISMSKFESRPSRTGLWEYVFFVDIDGHCEDLAVRTVLNEFAEHNVFVKVIGAYPQAVI